MTSIVSIIRDEIAPEKTYKHIIADLQHWPIVQLARDRKAVVAATRAAAVQRIKEMVGQRLSEEIALVIYQEGIRRRTDPWKIDLPDEDTFWKRTRRTLLRRSLDKDATTEGEAVAQNNDEILSAIVGRYADEIAGDFDVSVFQFTRKFTTELFNRFLNAAASTSWLKIWATAHRLQDRIKLLGEIERVRQLALKGTVILVPTHFSNLDSVLIGWAIDAIGLPAFSYGAGLNLFNFDLVAFFMNRLGAYKVDRRKKNLIYLETLKVYSQLTIERGVHSLFFPGGTRERSGALESKLKMGLLGTALEAQEAHFLRGNNDEKVFVVPVVLGYHFVLEAEGLIEEHLRRTGKEMYLVESDKRPSLWKTIKFIWQFFAESAEITVNFGQPIDVFGNFLAPDGQSIDKFGRTIDIKQYFVSDGVLKADAQRDTEYTKMLADTIVDRFHKENIVLSSHVVAYTAFKTLQAKNPNLDLYGILRLPDYETHLDYADYLRNIVSLQNVLFEQARMGNLLLSPEIGWEAEQLAAHGIKNLGVFHPTKPLLVDSENQVFTQNTKLLFYYHNKLVGYGLEKKVEW